MGKKQKNKKRGVTLTLSEFNEDGGGDPELLSLPSAPKAPEEWEALGGKPEYNPRGYRERTPGGPSRGGMGGRLGGGLGGRDYGMHGDQGDDFDDRDWSRHGPLDTEEHEQRGERDWGDMRRAQSMNQQHQEEAERDWNDMRRGPVDSSFGGMSGGDAGPGAEQLNWTQRRGPMDQMQFAQQPEADWSVARGGHVVEAKFDAEGGPIQERDWSQRKGPVEAEQQNVGGTQQQGSAQRDDQDWSAPRKGPVESEFVEAAPPVEERDWSERRGPVEAALPNAGADGAGSGNTGSVNNQELDWSERRGPVEAVSKPAQHTSPAKHGSSILNPPPFDDDDDDDDQDWAAVRSTTTPVAPPTPAETKTTKSSDSPSTSVRESVQSAAGVGQEDDARSEWTRRGPVQSKAEVQQEQMQRRTEGNGEHRDRGFGGRHRRGGGGGSGAFFGRNMSESADSDGVQTGSENQQGIGSGSWRRDAAAGVTPRGGGGRRSRGSFHQNRPTSMGHDGNNGGFAHANGGGQTDREPHHHREHERERDWGAARRSMPEGRHARSETVNATNNSTAPNSNDGGEQEHENQRSAPTVGRIGKQPGSADQVEQTMDPANQQAVEQQQGEDGRGSTGGVEDDEWTTVRASTRRDMRLSRRGSAVSGRWRGASGGQSGGPGSNGSGFRSSFNSNSMSNQRSFDRSSTGRSGDDSMSKTNSMTSRGSDGRAVFLERKRAGFSHLNSLDADADADETDGDLADADDADDDDHAKKSGNGDVVGSMTKMKSGGRFGRAMSPPTMGGGADTQVQ